MADDFSERLIRFLQEKWKDRGCSQCGAHDWNVGDSIFELRQFSFGDLVVGSGPIVPVLPIMCKNCGNTVLVNAIIAGVVNQLRTQMAVDDSALKAETK